MIFPEDKNKEAAALLYIFDKFSTLDFIAKTTADDDGHFQVNAFEKQTNDLEETHQVFAKLAVAIFHQAAFPLHLFNDLSDEELHIAFEAIKHCKADKSLYDIENYPTVLKEKREQYETKEKEPEEYIGQSDVANLLQAQGIDLDRRKVSVYYQRGHFPTPAIMVGKAPGWKQETIEQWAKDYEKGYIVPRRKR